MNNPSEVSSLSIFRRSAIIPIVHSDMYNGSTESHIAASSVHANELPCSQAAQPLLV